MHLAEKWTSVRPWREADDFKRDTPNGIYRLRLADAYEHQAGRCRFLKAAETRVESALVL
jgi:hypothetical protein